MRRPSALGRSARSERRRGPSTGLGRTSRTLYQREVSSGVKQSPPDLLLDLVDPGEARPVEVVIQEVGEVRVAGKDHDDDRPRRLDFRSASDGGKHDERSETATVLEIPVRSGSWHAHAAAATAWWVIVGPAVVSYRVVALSTRTGRMPPALEIEREPAGCRARALYRKPQVRLHLVPPPPGLRTSGKACRTGGALARGTG